MSTMLGAKVFVGKNTPPTSFLNSLIVKGGVEAIDRALRKLVAWNEKDPVCCPVVSIKEDGSINSARWVLLGSLGKNPRFMAHNLFSKSDKDMVITITLDDLKVFEYRENNASLWVESTELEVEIFDKVTKKILSTPEAEQRGVQTFCVRTVIQPDSHATALMWLGRVPMDVNNLKSKLPEEYKKTCCPQIALALGAGGARAKRILMSVREKEHEGFGFGCFPILEALYPGESIWPHKLVAPLLTTFLK